MREHQVVGRSINLPDEIATPINILIENVKSIGKPKQKAIIMELHEWEDGFMDVTEYERQCKSEIVDSFSDDCRIRVLSTGLNALVSNF